MNCLSPVSKKGEGNPQETSVRKCGDVFIITSVWAAQNHADPLLSQHPLTISPPHSPKNPTYPTMSKLQIDLIFNSCPVNHNVSYQGESKLLVKSKMSRDPPKRKCSVQVSSCCHASSTVSAVKWTRFPKKKEDTARNHFSTIKQLNKHL